MVSQLNFPLSLELSTGVQAEGGGQWGRQPLPQALNVFGQNAQDAGELEL